METQSKLTGLEQLVCNPNGECKALKDFLSNDDWWEMKQRGQNRSIYILTHAGVKKISNVAGISTDVGYTVLINPTHENNYTIAIQARVQDSNKVTTEIGEANRNNLGTRGKQNPVNMAQKRAFDRAVLTHLGIVGFLGEDELPDDDSEKMENLTPDEAKEIVDLLNEIFATKTKKELNDFSKKMKELKDSLLPKQVDVLRNAWYNQMNKFNKSF